MEMKFEKEKDFLSKDEIIEFRKDIPFDYYCNCKFCSQEDKFRGEIYRVSKNKYYHNKQKWFYLPEKSDKYPHNNPGQFVGYRFAIQQLTKPGDIVFDPTVGTGTAIFEAENNGRKGIGVELEFADTTRYYCSNQGEVYEGNVLEKNPDEILKGRKIDLIVNGTPYPTIGPKSADVCRNKKDYQDPLNIGKWKLKYFEDNIYKLYKPWIEHLNDGCYLCIIIKDIVVKKKNYCLHGVIANSILKNCPEMVFDSWFIHYHLPKSYSRCLFKTWEKKNPNLKITNYQTGIILKKEEL